MSIQAILFDLDNTLMPSVAAYDHALSKALVSDPQAFWDARSQVKARLPKTSPSSHNRALYFKKMQENSGRFLIQESLRLINDYEAEMLQFLRISLASVPWKDFILNLYQK